MIRHGEAESNLTESIRSAVDTTDALTEKGEQQLTAAAQDLKDKNIDLIVASPLMRTKQSAQQVCKALGLTDEQLVFDERLIELQAGATLEGKTWSDYQRQFSSEERAFIDAPAEGENRMDVVRRTAEWLFQTDSKYHGKNILVVSHLSVLFGLEVAAKGLKPAEAAKAKAEAEQAMFENAEVRELSFTPFPHNDKFELDFHRPYIDTIALFQGETQLVRVPDVFDCWFESGSMPYGQHHFMGENSDEFLKEYFPAQFIAE
jgi:broad specificity phosphatase PhoE